MKIAFRILVTLFAIAMATLEASARMGETLAQCDRRYGAQQQSPSTRMFPLLEGPGVTNCTYSYQGWRIKTAFIKGRAAMLRYSKTNNLKIEDDEVQAILKAEAHDGAWKEKSQFSWNPAKNLKNLMTHPRVWINDNGAKAYFENPQCLSLVIEAPVVEQYNNAKAQAAEQQRKSSIPEF